MTSRRTNGRVLFLRDINEISPPERGVLGLIAPDPLNFNNAPRDRPSLVAIGRGRPLLLMVMSELLIRSQG